ncbi:hypothetical protein [Litoreibacter janthinus]|nr:hypothetical protein [Litoreibacter janthinus]
MEHNENTGKRKSVQANAMSQIVAPQVAPQRITKLTKDHDAFARVEEF